MCVCVRARERARVRGLDRAYDEQFDKCQWIFFNINSEEDKGRTHFSKPALRKK